MIDVVWQRQHVQEALITRQVSSLCQAELVFGTPL